MCRYLDTQIDRSIDTMVVRHGCACVGGRDVYMILYYVSFVFLKNKHKCSARLRSIKSGYGG